MFFKRISDADITSYPIKFFSTGTPFTNVIKVIDQHDRFLRYPRPCSKVFQESKGGFIRWHQCCFLHRKWPASCYDFAKCPLGERYLAPVDQAINSGTSVTLGIDLRAPW